MTCSRDTEALILIGVSTRSFCTGSTVCGLAMTALYLWCPVHRFPPAQPFHGSRWYNPYAGVGPSVPWRKINLHAHSRVWLGLTSGSGTADDVLLGYRALGFDVAPTSNYQEISRATLVDSTALTVYEQGFNAFKVHFLVVAPRRVDWLDYPLLQGRDEEQHRIDRLRATSGLVILAHPLLRQALSDADLQALAGYTAMEIGSLASRGERAWNVALDAGRPVWGVANDDSHHNAHNDFGSYWTMVAAPSTASASLQEALTAGRAYAIYGHRGHADLALRSFALIGDTLSVAFDGRPAHVQLIGPGGRVLAQLRGDSAQWVIPCDAAWVRVVARTWMTQLFLQPLVRTETGALPRPEASVARAPTYLRRTLAAGLVLLGAITWLRSISARRRPESLGERDQLRPAA